MSNNVTLSFSNNQPQLTDLEQINAVLGQIGVRVSQIDIPPEAEAILKSAIETKLDAEQYAKILNIFSLKREDLLNYIKLAGRKPFIAGGGSLSTGEVNVAPYPKIYDMKARTTQDQINAQHKFARLHVNYADDGVGVDELMTFVSGGPWTWFFRIKNDVIVKLSIDYIPFNGHGWRLSYPGKIPHGAFTNVPYGIIVAYTTGPQTWAMRYESPSVEGAQVLGTNPWVDFSKNTPVLLEHIAG